MLKVRQQNRGIFISVEGVDGCGKTTLARSLVDSLNSLGFDAIYTCQPGNHDIGKELRNLILYKDMNVMSELLLFLSDRIESLDKTIIPKLNEGKIVICDRFNDSSIAYQGYGRGIDCDIIHKLIENSGCLLKPDLTLLIKLDLTICKQRRQGSDRIEKNLDNEKVALGFEEIASKNSERVVEIDGSLDKDNLLSYTIELIKRRFCFDALWK